MSALNIKEIIPFKNQIYNELKRDCLRKKIRFEDPYFPPNELSIHRTKNMLNGMVPVWLRPGKICTNPKFIVNSVNPHDICQGSVGDCWFMAALSGVALYPEMIARICPTDQSFNANDYAGIFHFRFWLHGQWYDVVVDDRLPVNPATGQLVFSQNKKEPNEFWGALIQKAYAKLQGGCYQYLEGGWSGDAITNLTGGIKEDIRVISWTSQNRHNELFQLILNAKHYKSISASSITSKTQRSDGLVSGHAYTITDIAQIAYMGQLINLIRLRNPWGEKTEWNGQFSDQSIEWQYVDSATRAKLKFRQDQDGEFWMPFNYFVAYFEKLEIVHLTPELFAGKTAKNCTWKKIQYDGQWISCKSAGGMSTDPHMRPNFWDNPQILMSLDKVSSNDGKTCVIVGLMLKNRRARQLITTGTTDLQISFYLYQVTDSKIAKQAKQKSIKLYGKHLTTLRDYPQNETAKYCTECVKRFRLPPGDYVIIPFCAQANMAGEFLLRIFTETPIDKKNAGVLTRGKRSLDDEDVHVQTQDETDDIIETDENVKEFNIL